MRVKNSSNAGKAGYWVCVPSAREGVVVSASTWMGVHGSCLRLRPPNVDREGPRHAPDAGPSALCCATMVRAIQLVVSKCLVVVTCSRTSTTAKEYANAEASTRTMSVTTQLLRSTSAGPARATTC